jgi:hypothetical protein
VSVLEEVEVDTCAGGSGPDAGMEGGGEHVLASRLQALGLRNVGGKCGVLEEEEFRIISRDQIPADGRIVKSLIWEYSLPSSGAGAATPFVVVLDVNRRVNANRLARALIRCKCSLDVQSLCHQVFSSLDQQSQCRQKLPVCRGLTRCLPSKVDGCRCKSQLEGLGHQDTTDAPGGRSRGRGVHHGQHPTLGHTKNLLTVIDVGVFDAGGASGDVYGGGGADGFELRNRPQCLLFFSHAVVEPISVREEEVSKAGALALPGQQKPDKQKQGDPNDLFSTASAIRKASAKPWGADQLSKLLSASDLPADLLSLGTDQSGKTALQLASWRGSVDNVRLLLDSVADIDAYSTGPGNYGKTVIFYALTRCRDDMVAFLLSRGADVLICNNKGQVCTCPWHSSQSHQGIWVLTCRRFARNKPVLIHRLCASQTPLSIAVTHVKPAIVELIEKAEARQMAEGHQWRNFRATHSDYRSYGHLDPRFGLDAANGWPPGSRGALELGVKCVRPTTLESRRGCREARSIHSEARDEQSRDQDVKPPPTSLPTQPADRPALPTLTVGTSLCHLVGIIISQRRIGRALVFLNIVPLPDP